MARGNADSHDDSLLAPSRPVHRRNTEVGQPPPPTVPSVRHDGAMAVPEWSALAHNAVQEGGRAEAMAIGDRRGKCGNCKGVQRLWDHP